MEAIYKKKVYLVEISDSPSRYRIHEDHTFEDPSEYQAEVKGISGHVFTETREDFHSVTVTPLNMDSLTSSIEDRRRCLQRLVDANLGLSIDYRTCGVMLSSVDKDDVMESFEVSENDFDDFIGESYPVIVMVHNGIRGKYIEGIYRAHLGELLINENADIIYPSQPDYTPQNLKREYRLALDIQDIVCGDKLDERYSLE